MSNAVAGAAFAAALSVQPAAAQVPAPSPADTTSRARVPRDTVLRRRSRLDSVVVRGDARRYGARRQSAATFLDAPVRDVPQAVQTVTRAQLADVGAVSFVDLYRLVPSAQEGAPRGVPYAASYSNLRGQVFPIAVNGLRNRFGTDADPSMLFAVERIEVLKGPAGVLFGAEGVGGAVNLVTRRPERAFASQAQLSGGGFDTRRGSVDVTGPLAAKGVVAVRVIGEVERSGDVTRFNRVNRENTLVSVITDAGGRAYGGLEFLNVHARSPANSTLGLPRQGTVEDLATLRLDPRAYYGEPSIDGVRSRSTWLTGTGGLRLSPGWTLELVARHSQFNTGQRRTLLGAVDVAADTVARTWREASVNADQYLVRLLAKGEVRTGPVAHRLAAGGEVYRADEDFAQPVRGRIAATRLRVPTYGPVALPTGGALVFSQDIRYRELLAQDLMTLTPRLRVLAGVRRVRADIVSSTDDVRTDDGQGSASLQGGAVYQPSPRVSLFANAATTTDPTAAAGARSRSGGAFDPEQARSLEGGAKLDLPAGVVATLSAFDLTRRNVLTPDPADPDFSVQTGRQRTRGAEFEGTFARGGWGAQAGYAYLDARVLADNGGTAGNTLGGVSRQRFTSWARYEVPRAGAPAALRRVAGLGLGAGLYAVASQYTTSANTGRVPGYRRADVSASYALARTRLQLTLRNAFDARYFTGAGFFDRVYPGEPRNLQATVAARF
jgi:iron complex outermembrane receptor protein